MAQKHLIMEISKEQKMIDEIMDNFEFSKGLETMEALNWKIHHEDGYSIPDHESILRRMARRCLYDCIDLASSNINDETFVKIGPFRAQCYYDVNGIAKLDLMFIVCDWEVYIDEIE